MGSKCSKTTVRAPITLELMPVKTPDLTSAEAVENSLEPVQSETVTRKTSSSNEENPRCSPLLARKEILECSWREMFDNTLHEIKDYNISVDAILECYGGSVEVHSCLLMTVSTYFWNMFTNPNETPSEHFYRDNIPMKMALLNEDTPFGIRKEQVDLRNTEVEVVQVIVQFLYTGELPPDLETNDNLLYLMFLVTYNLQIEILFNYCRDVLLLRLRLDNFVEIWNYVNICSNEIAVNAIVIFMQKNFDLILKDSTYLKLGFNQICAFASRSQNCISCDEIVEFILQWGNHDFQERELFVASLVKLVDVSQLSNYFIGNCLDNIVIGQSTELTNYFSNEAKLRLKSRRNLWYYTTNEKGILNLIYNLSDKRWYTPELVYVPQIPVKTRWCMIPTSSQRYLYFALTTWNELIIYDKNTKKSCKGPTVETQFVCGVTCINDVYFLYNAGCFVRFNIKSQTWENLASCQRGTLLTVRSKIFVYNIISRVLYEYDFTKNSWKLHSGFQDELRAIQSNCFVKNCNEKIYFIRNRVHLLSYDPDSGEWDEKMLPEMKNKKANYVECDLSIISFCEYNSENFVHGKNWIYHIESGAWEKIPQFR